MQLERTWQSSAHVRGDVIPTRLGHDGGSLRGSQRWPRHWSVAHRLLRNTRPKKSGRRPGGGEFLLDRSKACFAVLAQVFDAVAGYIHPKWTGDVADGHDVAVLKLNREANLTLPRLGTGNVVLDRGDYLAATGWGVTKSGVPSKKLQVATHLALVGQDKCKEQPQGVDAKSWICAGGLQEDTCKGHLDRLRGSF